MTSNSRRFSSFDWAALVLSIAAVLAAYWMHIRIFEGVPHIEDEIAYVWEANAMAEGVVTVPTPPLETKFLIPFVVDHEGQRFGKYPLGWPAMLSIGIRLGLRGWVNPLFAGLAVWLTYRLGKRLMGDLAGLVAALLTVLSPFFLMISGSLLSHAFGLTLALTFVLAWWDSTLESPRPGLPGWLPPVTAAFSLGVLAISRPFSAVAVAFPFVLHGAYLLVRSPALVRRNVLIVAVLGAVISLLHPLWQAAATGDPTLNPYELWWSYDRVGFGPGYGVTKQGHNLRLAWINTAYSVRVGMHDLFGWAGYSWLLLPFGVWAARRNGRLLAAGSVVIMLLLFYGAYWVGSWTFGPRYQYEGLFSLTLLSAAGLCWLAGWPLRPGERYERARGRLKLRRLTVFAMFALLLAVNLAVYLPMRLNTMRNLYEISADALAPFEQAGDLAPAVVIVHTDRWMDYGELLELQDPFLTSPFIFTWGVRPGIYDVLAADFPERAVYHYYPEEPGKFYTGPKGE